jgi:LacI family transcriptional regulator
MMSNVKFQNGTGISEGAGRKITASDVAQRAGVSKWTVSRAFTQGASISPDALERVLRAAAELGYRPNLLARSLTTRRTNIVGLVVDELANPNMFPVLDEVTRQLQRKGYMSMLLNITAEHSQGSALSLADQFQVDGLIFLGTILTDELLQLAQDIRNIPLIVLYRNSDNPDIQVVTTDGYRAGREIASLMTEQRYRRIGYMVGPFSESTQLKRLDGFRDGLAEQGLEVSIILEAGHYDRVCGFQTITHYLETTPPDARVEALFCENDILAIGVLDALRARRETGQIAVVGFDDIELAASPSYGLTTYRQPLEQLVAEAIRRLTAEGETSAQHLVPGELIRRASHIRGLG